MSALTIVTNNRRRELAHDGHAAAKYLGHTMSRLAIITLASGKSLYRANCKQCCAYFDVNLLPAANEIALGGDALATNCAV